MYAREIDGQTFSFGVSGKLIRNVLVMYDRQTDSLWSQLLGEAVAGPMVGTKLEFLPSWMMTWEEWRERHPETLVLSKNGRRTSRDVYEGYYQSDSAGVIGRTFFDDRLATKEMIIGVAVADTAVAYPFRVLADEPVVNDAVGDEPVLIWFDAGSSAAAAYNRQVADHVLTFSPTDNPARMRDQETGTVWDGFQGIALSGPLAGEKLERVKSTTSFWFGWRDFHPETAVYGLDE